MLACCATRRAISSALRQWAERITWGRVQSGCIGHRERAAQLHRGEREFSASGPGAGLSRKLLRHHRGRRSVLQRHRVQAGCGGQFDDDLQLHRGSRWGYSQWKFGPRRRGESLRDYLWEPVELRHCIQTHPHRQVNGVAHFHRLGGRIPRQDWCAMRQAISMEPRRSTALTTKEPYSN